MLDAQQAVLVEKEEVENLHFPHAEVLTDPIAIKQRKTDLERATTLGNVEHNKIKIFFEDDNSFKVVETTIWATGEDNIVLKKGVTIPVHRIHRIKFL
ncbi:MAG: hypothetical protein V4616_13730 [Bacteroidota bacterium]